MPDPCNGNGTCANGTGQAVCTCKAGWTGATCNACVYFVDGASTGTADGSSWGNAFTKIQPAIDAAKTQIQGGVSSCDVWVKAGTYYQYVSDAVSDGVRLAGNVGVYGGFAGTETKRSDANPIANSTILSGRQKAGSTLRVEHVVAAFDVENAVIDGFTIQDGDANGAGGSTEDDVGGGFLLYAFNDQNASATVSRCEITGNTAEYGGGLANQWGSPTLTVTSCNIHGNTATVGGGGGMAAGYGTFKVTSSTVQSNGAAGDGGGISCPGTCTVTGSTIQSNTTTGNGGGIVCQDTCTVTGSTIQGNTANAAGGIKASSNTALAMSNDKILDNAASGGCAGLELAGYPTGVTLSDLYVSGNSTVANGGGICSHKGSITLSNLVLVGNTANTGGGIYEDGAGFTCVNCTITGNQALSSNDAVQWNGSDPSQSSLINTIVWGNPDSGATTNKDAVLSATVATSHSDVAGYTGSDATTFSANPLFTSVPKFFDRTTAASSDGGSVVVSSAAGYATGDVLEIGGDGVARAVTSIVGTTVKFLPALSAAVPSGVQVRDWGATLGTLNLQLRTGSTCIDAGDTAAAPAMDITGQPRSGPADIGAYEHP